jgi:RNA polymerase sigma-B factor
MSESAVWQQDPEFLVLRYLEEPRADLKDLIMVQYAGMVERIARKFAGIEPMEDLVQVGFIGLLNSLSKFDPQAGVRFNTYATYLVAGEIKHYLRDRAQTIRQPAWVQELRHKANKVATSLRQTLGREPSYREIADELSVSESTIQEVFATAELMKVASLDATVAGEDEGETDVERLDSADFCPEQLSMEDRLVLENAMSQLRDLERQVLMHFHFEAMSQTEIAAKLGISCNYVSHILRQSLSKLRKILHAEDERDRLLRREASDVDYEIIDEETGAYTEAYFRSRIEEELHRASAEQTGVAVVLVRFTGLDQMKKFYGEQSVADFLTDAASFLKDNVRRLDVVARFGPNGFGVILPTTGANVAIVKQRIFNRAQQWALSRFGGGTVEFEIGEASSPEDGKTAKQLLEHAEPKPATQSVEDAVAA